MQENVVNVTKLIDERKLGPFQKKIAILCALIVFTEGFDTQSVGYVAPVLAREWSMSPAEMALLISLGLFGLMLGAALIAPIADRIGRRPLLLCCIPTFAIGSLLTGFATSETMLYAARFLTGFGIGGALPNVIALMSEYAPHRSRAFLVVLMFNGFVLGATTVGLIASRIVPLFGWHSVFILGGILPLLLMPLLIVSLPESIRVAALQGNRRDTVLNLLRRLAPDLRIDAQTQVISGEKHVEGHQVAALFREGRARKTILLWIIFFMSLLNLYLIASWIPTAVSRLGVPVGTAMLIGVLFQVGGIFGTVFGWWADKVGASLSMRVAYGIAAAGIVCMVLSGDSVPLLMISVFFCGFGVLGGQTVANASSAILYPTEIRATGAGWATGIGRIGSIIGPGLAGLLMSAGMPPQHVFLLAVIPALCAAVAATGLGTLRTQLLAKDAEAPA